MRSVQFLGAAGTVTGSMHLVAAAGRRVALDAGLFQGLKELRLRNWEPRLADPAKLDAVVLSHAHIDHTGYLPLLVRQGFRGPVYCTAATAALLEVLLPDAAFLQEEEAERANRYGYSKHKPALPLYTVEDAHRALELLESRPFGRPFEPVAGVAATYRRAGHIMGAASIDLALDGRPVRRLVFSGDVGRWGQPIIKDPDPPPAADVLLLESTYGDRDHPGGAEEALVGVVRDGARRGGAILVPAFAVGRTQELLWRLEELAADGRIPDLPVYVDSPMAADVTDIYSAHAGEHDARMVARVRAGRDPLGVRFARTRDESKALNALHGPVIIISASGMATGGRILHHLNQRLEDPRTTVLLAGFQAAGTRGRALKDGARAVRIFGREVAVRAHVATLDALSAHADRAELLRWLGGFQRPPGAIHLVHGEPEAAAALADAIRGRVKQVAVARHRETVSLEP